MARALLPRDRTTRTKDPLPHQIQPFIDKDEATCPSSRNIEWQNVQLCIFKAKEQPCTRKDFEFFHKPKERRLCWFFHTKGEYSKDVNQCLLGHWEAKEAVMLRTIHLKMAKQHKTHDATSGAGNIGERATSGNAMATATSARVGAEATGPGDNGQARTMIAGAAADFSNTPTPTLRHPSPQNSPSP
jgi:hypothetical protein